MYVPLGGKRWILRILETPNTQDHFAVYEKDEIYSFCANKCWVLCSFYCFYYHAMLQNFKEMLSDVGGWVNEWYCRAGFASLPNDEKL